VDRVIADIPLTDHALFRMKGFSGSTVGVWNECARLARRAGAVALAVLFACSDSPSGPSRPPGVDRVEVVPATAWLSPGATLTLEGAALKSDGTTASGVSFKWATSAPNVATVSTNGTVQAVAAGQATIEMSVGSLRATSAITVVPAVPSAAFGIERQGVSDVSLLGAWADDVTAEAFAVGQLGKILHHSNGTWTLQDLGTEETLVGVWGSGTADVWTVGTSGFIAHWNGVRWERAPSPTSETLLDVFGLATNDIYAVGVNGTILHYDGSQWSVMTTGNPWELWGVWGASPTDIYAVGQNGVIVHFNGIQWALVASPTASPLFAVWGSSGSDIWAAGINGLLLHYDGASWRLHGGKSRPLQLVRTSVPCGATTRGASLPPAGTARLCGARHREIGSPRSPLPR
jgi:hypothetical protein